ncbi:hypothetical protein TNCV_4502711 [Trichonephila clavipes]|nr:hypothetical protein TNCV_4502711 [Trichonephila clavipes]
MVRPEKYPLKYGVCGLYWAGNPFRNHHFIICAVDLCTKMGEAIPQEISAKTMQRPSENYTQQGILKIMGAVERLNRTLKDMLSKNVQNMGRRDLIFCYSHIGKSPQYNRHVAISISIRTFAFRDPYLFSRKCGRRKTSQLLSPVRWKSIWKT